MEVGTQVEILSGKHKGRIGAVSKVYPGRRMGDPEPYYLQVRLEAGVTIDAVRTRLRQIETPN